MIGRSRQALHDILVLLDRAVSFPSPVYKFPFFQDALVCIREVIGDLLLCLIDYTRTARVITNGELWQVCFSCCEAEGLIRQYRRFRVS